VDGYPGDRTSEQGWNHSNLESKQSEHCNH
jgi:hypothetical protein